MADIQVVFLREVLSISRVEPVDNLLGGLRITMPRAREVEVILINGIQSPSVVPLSDTQLLAEVPSTVMGDVVRSVSALSRRPTVSDRSALAFRLLRQTKRASGIQRLVQRFVLMLLSNPGSDVFHPQQGGGFLSLVEHTTSGRMTGNLQGAVQQCITKTVQDLRSLDAKNSRLHPDEKIDQAVLSNFAFDVNTTTIAVRVGLTAVSGDSALSNLFA